MLSSFHQPHSSQLREQILWLIQKMWIPESKLLVWYNGTEDQKMNSSLHNGHQSMGSNTCWKRERYSVLLLAFQMAWAIFFPFAYGNSPGTTSLETFLASLDLNYLYRGKSKFFKRKVWSTIQCSTFLQIINVNKIYEQVVPFSDNSRLVPIYC